MKKRVIALAICVMMGLVGCGSAEEKVIGGDVNVQVTNTGNGQDSTGNVSASANTSGTEINVKGYAFAEKGLMIQADGDMANYLDTLGEPASYFEAASCAFDGLDKVYTYPSYVIKTYPQGKQDMVSEIILMDDSVTTAEGIAIGASADEVHKVYGSNYVENGSMHVYEKDGVKLGFLLEGGAVTSIQYRSTVLDEN